jgi:RNA polymerase sigma-70 factor (ECF subfamily)
LEGIRRGCFGVEADVDEVLEDKLVRRSQRGDQEAFDELMQAHHEQVYRLAFRLTGGADEADSVTQDTFVQAYCSLRKFKRRSRLMTWLYSIAVRKAMDLRRERQSNRETVSLAEDCPATPGDSRRSAASGPLEALREKEFAALLSDAMMKLPPDQRATLALVAQEGLSYREAARILSFPEGTVAWRVWKARQFLRDALGDYLEP